MLKCSKDVVGCGRVGGGDGREQFEFKDKIALIIMVSNV